MEDCVTGLLDSVSATAPDQINQVTTIIDDTAGDLVEDKLQSDEKLNQG